MGTNESVRFVRSAKVTGVIPCQRRGCAAKREDDDDDSTGTSHSNLDPAGVRGLARRAGGFAGPWAGSGDRKSVVWGKSGSTRVDIGGSGSLKKKNKINYK